MRNNKLHTPEGVRDLLPFDCSRKNEIENRIESVFHRYGYNNIETPTFEYYEVFSDDTGSIESNQMYKFFDRDGSILALRADMTPAIARVVATAYRQEELPLRFCYSGNAYRYNENYQGKLREFSQSGIELIGVNSEDADAEMIAVAVNSILAAGLEEFRIDIGQVEFFEGLLEEAGFDDETAAKVQDMIAQRDYIALEEILEETSISDNIKTIFIDFPKLVGSVEILKSTKKLITNKKAISALDKLESLYLLCKAYGIEKYISFDLGMITHLNYYTGIIFRGYTYGTGFSILDGGRYDKLIKQYGMDTPAIGFAIRVNELLNIFERQNIAIEINTADTLITYTIEGRSVALSVADQLRSTGVYVENSLFGDNIDKNIAYAKAKKMGGILYFKDEQNVEIINIESGDRMNTTVAALVEQGENK
jgi:ATP phosphoribosyltransferase regulatory subunit